MLLESTFQMLVFGRGSPSVAFDLLVARICHPLLTENMKKVNNELG